LKHTPTPWHTGKSDSRGSVHNIYSGKSKEPTEGIATCYRWVGSQEAEANADFIVRACNAHDAVVEELNRTAGELANLIRDEFLPDHEYLERWFAGVEAARKLAEGR